MKPVFRIRDLISSKTLIETGRGREITEYWQKNNRLGYSDWIVQYSSGDEIWRNVPVIVLKRWLKKWKADFRT